MLICFGGIWQKIIIYDSDIWQLLPESHWQPAHCAGAKNKPAEDSLTPWLLVWPLGVFTIALCTEVQINKFSLLLLSLIIRKLLQSVSSFSRDYMMPITHSFYNCICACPIVCMNNTIHQERLTPSAPRTPAPSPALLGQTVAENAHPGKPPQ